METTTSALGFRLTGLFFWKSFWSGRVH